MCITRVSQGRVGAGRTVGSGKGLCVLFIQVFPRPARVSLRHVCIHKGTHSDFTLHSSLEFGGSTTISPKSSPRLCALDPQLGSHPLAHPAPRLPSGTFCRNMEPTCGRTHTAAAALWRVCGLAFISPGVLVLLRGQVLCWRGSFSLAFPLPLLPRSSARGSFRSTPLTCLSPLGKRLPSRLMWRRRWP